MTQKLSQYIILHNLANMPEDAKCQRKIAFGIEYPLKTYITISYVHKNNKSTFCILSSAIALGVNHPS